MAKLVPFPIAQVRRSAASVIKLSARCSKPTLWTDRPAPPEHLGNMLQHLTRAHPGVVLMLESIVAEVYQEVDAPQQQEDGT